MAGSMARQGMSRSRALWLRCDLRLDDHPALVAACQGAESLLPVYVVDPDAHNRPTLAGARKSSARRARFLLEGLACLRRRLEARGSGLAIVMGKPQDALPGLCGESTPVFVTQGVGTEEKADEARVAKRLRGGELQRVWGNTLYAREECGCPPDGAPLLFTNFKNRAESRGRIRDPLDAPSRLPPLPRPQAPELKERLDAALELMPTLEQMGYPTEEAREAMKDDPRGVMPFEGGEDAALARLKDWMWDNDRLREYFEIRNGMLGEGYSSKLSPWLALGCISPRRIWKEAQRYEKERTKNKSTYWLIFELTWRDFFVYMAESQGAKLFVPGGVTGDRTPWRGSKADLEKWKDGRTGDPLVDANMRELKATGFMSNRGRQNVASYLIFDLEVDWRYGAAHFEELLLDYDPGSNWGNWVAAAGLTGQRVNRFNTRKQLSDYDPGREYVNHWLRDGGARAALTAAAGQVGGRDGKGAGKGASSFGKGSKSRGKGSKGDDSAAKKQRRWGKDQYHQEALQGA